MAAAIVYARTLPATRSARIGQRIPHAVRVAPWQSAQFCYGMSASNTRRPMIYADGDAYLAAPQKAVALFGMSGLGKTTVAQRLRETSDWFHYSVDYRIGTRYMDEHIADNFKRAAMQVSFLRELLLSDSIHIASNMTFENLTPLSTYLGKPGDPDKGGIAFEEYLRRQRLHRTAEINAMMDTVHFITRAQDIYGYPHFLCDTSGSLCEIVDPHDPQDPVLSSLAQHTLLVQIRGTEADAEELARRFDKAPKPMYYPEAFLLDSWQSYCAEKGVAETDVDPDDFIRWGFRRLITHRVPRYDAIAEHWGISVPAEAVATLDGAEAFNRLIANELDFADHNCS